MSSELARKTKVWYEARINLLHAEMELELEKLKGPPIRKVLVPATETKIVPVDAHDVRAHMRRIEVPVKPEVKSRKKNLDMQEILRLRTLGYSQKNIAAMMGVSQPTIGNRLKEHSANGFIETSAPEVRSVVPHQKERPRTHTPNVSQRVMQLVKNALLSGNQITALDCEEQLEDVGKKSIASAFSSISMCLTDMGGATRRVQGRGGRVHLLPENEKIIKHFCSFDLHKWKKERYNIE
jgi:predicted transcriptional regulator